MFYIRKIKYALPLLLIAAALFVRDAKAEPQEPLRLEALVEELLKVNPEIQAADARYQAALARPSAQGAMPDPRINFGWMSAGTILPGGQLGENPNSNIGLQVSQEFPYPGKRGLRSDLALKEADSDKQLRSATLRNRVASLKSAFFELSYACDALKLLQENQQTLQQLGKVAEARYSVGKAMQQDLIRAQTEVAILQTRILALEQKKQSAAAEINTLLDRPAVTPTGQPEALPLPSLEPYDVLLARARENSPTLQSTRFTIDKEEAGVKLAQKESYPDFEVMMGYYYQGAMTDMWEVRAGISIPVFYKSRQRKQVEEATLKLGEAKLNYRAAETSLEFSVRNAYVKADTARSLMDLYEKQITPLSGLALESSLVSYESGGVDFLTVLSNFSTIVEYRLNHLEQRTEYLKALAALEELAGLPGDAPGPKEAQS